MPAEHVIMGNVPKQPDADDARAESVWVRTIVGWHVAFWLMLAVVAVSVLNGDGVGTRNRLGALATLALVGCCYAWLTRTPGHERVRRNAFAYLTVLCAAVLTLLALAPGVGFFLFLAFPQVWFLSERLVDGIAWSVVLSTCALVGFGLQFGFSGEVMRDLAPDMAISLVFSLVLGIWISSVIGQSEQRAELIAELERTRAELGRAQHAAGVVAERERLARDIHDTLAQGFTSVIALAQAERARLAADGDAAPRLALLEETARENLGEARALVAAFAPVDLQGAGLVDALRRLTERFSAETGVPVRLELPPGPAGGGLGTAEAVVLLRVAQESLSNVRRHARAAHVTLRLRREGDGVGVEVTDDGAGFDAGQVAGSSFGLSSMRSRVEEAGGRFAVDSRPGTGTRVSVSLP